MSLISVQDLYKDALSGKKLTSAERRHVIAYLEVTDPEKTYPELAVIFQVSERMISKDKQSLRLQIAKNIKKDSIDLIVGDIHTAYRRIIKKFELNVKDLEDKGQKGTVHYTKALESWLISWEKYKTMCQNLGILPESVQPQTTTEYVFKTIITKEGGAISEEESKIAERMQYKVVGAGPEKLLNP